MNKERILAVADAIEKSSVPELGFSMRSFRSDCGTAACIAGWAFVLFAKNGENRFRRGVSPYDIEVEGQVVLGLKDVEAGRLFYASGVGVHYATRGQAIAALRHLAATGVVDWLRDGGAS